MAFSIASLLDPSLLIASGGGLLGFVGGQVKVHRGRVAKLEKEVEECRKRDADFQIITAGVRMVVGKMRREDPDSPELRMFADLCHRRLGPPPAMDDFADLLSQLDDESDGEQRDD